MLCRNNGVSDKLPAGTRGGYSRCWFFLDFPRSSSIRRGRRFREIITGSKPAARIISRRFTRRKFLERPRTRGLANLHFGRRGWYFRLHFLFCGDRADFVSPAIIIAAHITKDSGPTRSRAPSVSRAKNISAKNISR